MKTALALTLHPQRVHHLSRVIGWLLLFLALVVMPRPIRAAQITIPLNIDYLTLREALKRQIYTGPNGRADLWNGSDACQYLNATDPRFFLESSHLALQTNAELSLGLAVGDNCVSPLEWSGLVVLDLQPHLGNDLVIRFRVTDLNLYKPDHEKSLLVDRGFDLIKGNLIPRIETFSFDLKPALEQLDTLVRAGVAPDAAERISKALATLHPTSAIVSEPNSLRVTLAFTAPDMPSTLPSVSSAPLSQEDLKAWEGTLDNWDAFMVFAVEQLGGTVTDPKVRADLLDLLLDSRYRLVQALSEPQGPNGPDPVRIIFLDEWTRLGDIVRSAAQQGLLKDRSLEFLSFISAGDALFALDQAAPVLGLRISADDLRRLARLMAPQSTADPLAFGFDEDPALQKMFGVTAPLETPGPFDQQPADAITTRANASSSPMSMPVTSPQPPATSEPHSFLGLPFRFSPATADAAENPLPAQLFRVGVALNRVVVDQTNARDYKSALQNLLTLTTEYELNQSDPAPGTRPIYFNLVKTTAWQESCWRQFVRRNNKIRYLESSTGDIGLMQVNKHVWRGFYSLPRLEWDVIYNAGAGAQILLRLMNPEVDRGSSHEANSDMVIARSVYAAYNGGPAAHDRWLKHDEPKVLRAIDDAFWQKYQATRSGKSFDIMQCSAQWNTAPGH